MKTWLKVACSVTAALLIVPVTGCNLFTHNVFGNPDSETFVEDCTIPNTQATIRLYLGNGGATSAYWYSVTFQEDTTSKERQIFYSYAYPSIKGIDCRTENVSLTMSEGQMILSLEEIQTTLIQQPQGYYKGEPDSRNRGLF